jgi:fatty-acyl-CoA synthase
MTKTPELIPWDEHTRMGDLPQLAAIRWRGRDALQFRGQWQSFTALAMRVDEAARGLMAAGIEPGERVAVWLNNCPEWIYLMFAIAKIGAIQVPINTRFRTGDATFVIQQAECSTLITHDTSGPIDYWKMVREMVPDRERDVEATVNSVTFPALKRIIIKVSDPGKSVSAGVHDWRDLVAAGSEVSPAALADREQAVRPRDPVFIMYTSGTTGFPKGVVRHHGLLRNHVDRAVTLGVTEHDVMFNYLPLFHIFGYVDGPLLSMLTGNRQILAETFDPDECLDAVEREGVSLLFGFETHFKELVAAQEQRPRVLSSLRTGIFAGGMNSAVPVARKALKVLSPFRPVTAYGMTEVAANACLSRLDSTDEQFCETSGLPCDGFEFRIIDPVTGQDQPTGTAGEIIVKSYNLMMGYYRRPEETAAAYDDEGWFHTGDMGYVRADGYLRFLGRYKDMLKIGGENVDPMEVEGYLLTHPDVAQVAVVGFPDQRLTEVAVAFVVRVAGSEVREQDIIGACRGKFASFKIPRHVIFVTELPMTTTRKIQKVKLRQQAIETLATAATD